MRLRARLIVLFAALASVTPGAARAQGVSPTAASAAQKADAQAKYDSATRLFDAGRREEALAAFRASYAAVASPNALLMVATTQADLGDVAAAYETYGEVERAAKELAPPKYRAAGAAAHTEREALRPRLALITLRVTGAEPGARVTVGGREIPPDRWTAEIPVNPGDVLVTGALASGRSIEQHVAATAGKSSAVALDLASPAPAPVPAPGPSPSEARPPGALPDAGGAPGFPASPEQQPRASLLPYAIAAGAVGVTGLSVFVIAGAMNRGTYSDLEARCPNRQCTGDVADDVDAGRKEQAAANVGAAFAIGGFGVGIALLVVDRTRSPSRRATPSARASRPDVWIGARSIGLRGGF